MELIKNIWKYMVTEPLSWIFYSIFQPSRFKRDFEVEGFFARVIPMFRLFLPIFAICYPLALAVKITIHYFLPALASCCFSSGEGLLSIPSYISLLLTTLLVS